MTAVEGGSVACFVLRVLGTLQYLCAWGRGINSLLFPLRVWSVTREFFLVSAVLAPKCGARKGVVAARAG